MTEGTHPCEACHYPTDVSRRLCRGCSKWKFVCRECDEIRSRDFEAPNHEDVCRPCVVEKQEGV